MKFEDAKNAVFHGACFGCEHLKEDVDGFECVSSEAHDCENHKIEAASLLIAEARADALRMAQCVLNSADDMWKDEALQIIEKYEEK